jgi:D-beta-D-heptose 7-phosphate kinase/D-beta-D-heptose 1-phosphate adenosyltransferase
LIAGDLMIDQFVWGSVSRISPEAPVPVVRLERESSALGGAGNVLSNVIALGARALPVGVRGEDREGEQLERLCRSSGSPTEGLVTAPGRPTTVKTRIVAHHQHVVRVDREEDGPLPPAVAQALRERALACLDRAAAVVVSDYDKGAVSRDLLAALLPEASRRRLPVVIDPKIRLFLHYRPCTVVTPNAREAMEAAGMRARTDAEFEAMGRRLLEQLGSPYLLITRGDRGMLLLNAKGGTLTIPAVAREVFDVTGAGDTVVALLALALAAGATMEESAILANRAAGVVVGKLGTATLTAQELLSAGEEGPKP